MGARRAVGLCGAGNGNDDEEEGRGLGGGCAKIEDGCNGRWEWGGETSNGRRSTGFMGVEGIGVGSFSSSTSITDKTQQLR